MPRAKTTALDELMTLIEHDVGLDGNCAYEPDDEPVGMKGDGTPMAITFGHIRRARAELTCYEAALDKIGGYVRGGYIRTGTAEGGRDAMIGAAREARFR